MGFGGTRLDRTGMVQVGNGGSGSPHSPLHPVESSLDICLPELGGAGKQPNPDLIFTAHEKLLGGERKCPLLIQILISFQQL